MSDLVKRIHDNYRVSTRFLNASNGVDFDGWIEEATKWYRLVNGSQWESEDYFAMLAMNRPVMTFNRVGVMLDVVSGLEIQNKLEPSFFPRDYADVQITDTRKAEYMNGVMKWIRDEDDMDVTESAIFSDMLVCGMGWSMLTLDYAEDADGMIAKVDADPLRCRYDPSCSRKNLKGSRWRMYIMDLPIDEIEARWNKKIDDFSSPWDSDIDVIHGERMYLADKSWRYDGRYQFNNRGKDEGDAIGRVGVYQYIDIVEGYRVNLGDRSFNLTNKEFKERKEDIEGMGLQYVKQHIKRVRQAHVIGNTLLDDTATLTGDYTLNCMTGKYDKSNRCFYGLVRPMKDPQLWANKFVSSILDIIASQAKGGVMAETGAFLNEKRALEEWTNPDAVTMLNHGGLGKIGAKPIAQVPPGIQYLLEYTSSMFPHTSGISMELMGLVGKDQPGVLEYQRKQSGLSILAWAFNSLRAYRRDDAKAIMEIVRNFMSDGRMVRIDGEAGPEIVQILKDQLSVKYDVVVDESPMSVNSKERTWNMIVEVAPMLIKAGIPMPPDLIKYSPLPEALKLTWMDYIKQSQENQQEEQESTLDRARAAKEMATAEKEQAAKQNLLTQAQKNSVEAKTKAIEAAVKQQELQVKGGESRSKISKEQADIIDKMASARLKEAQAIAALRDKEEAKDD